MSAPGFLVLLISAMSCRAAPTLENDNCQKPEPIKEAQLQGEWNDEFYPPGKVANFICLPGYTQEGAIKMACVEGTWFHIAKGQCKEDTSCMIPLIDNGNVINQKTGYTSNEVIQFICKEGFYPNTNRDIRCTKDGWLPKPSCDEIVCSPYSSVEKGRLVATKTVYKFDDEIDVVCDDGYVLQVEPNKRRKCTSNGWFPPARCVTKKCDRPDIKNGSIYNDYWYPKHVGRTLDYKCDTNYLSHERLYRGSTTCTNVGWIPEPKCSRQCLYRKAFFDNAELLDVQNAYLDGEKVKFQCKYNYQTPDGKDNGERACLPDGEFTPAKCSKTCKAPELLSGRFQTIQNQFELGESLLYECNEGYMTESKNHAGRIHCQSRGWSEEPKCISITCEYNDELYKAGEVVKYTCPQGQMPEYEIGQCFTYGWGPPLICNEMSCKPPPRIPNSKIDGETKASYASGEKVTYVCSPGYTLARPLTGEAQCENTHWLNLPVCRRIGDQCGPPPVVQFGDIISFSKLSYKSGEYVEYKCPEYYILKGRSTVRCVNGAWDEAPVCLEPCTARERDMTENNIQLKWSPSRKIYASHGDSVQFICMNGYEAPAETNMRAVCEQGKLNYPKCFRKEKKQQCPSAYSPINAEIQDPKIVYYSNDTVTMVCARGYKMYGSPIIRCIEGKWEEPPECIQSTPCRNPPIINNGDITESSIKQKYDTNDIVTYSCKLGFHLIGPDQITCLNGQWTTLPTCTENPCDHPPEIEHATIVKGKDTFNHGERATYECKNGYRFSGEDSATCVKGRWMSKPICIETSCKPPPRVPNSRINGQTKASYVSGEKVTYVCNPSYSLQRSMTGEAQCEDTHWINLPVCRRIGEQCGPPPVLQFGDITSFSKPSYASGESVEYKCPEYYILQGSSTVRCMNGAWDEAPVCLEPCTASEKDMEVNNIQSKWRSAKKLYIKHGDIIEFQCINGYETPADMHMRVICEQGKLNYPKCYKRGFCVLDQSTMIIQNIWYDISIIVEPGSITFQCNEGMIPENGLEATCVWGKLKYPKCIAAA